MILILTARPAPLRQWVEQVRARYGDDVTVVAGVSAALEPAASPYLDRNAGQLTGVVAGVGGAAAYEHLRGVPGRAMGRLNGLAVGHLAIVVLLVVGALLHAPGGLFKRKKKGAQS
ncbi:MAG TPA: hypothetical protein ENK17_06620 [Anaerolineae bacterium]|nr:hypothetical protein [Anaerolineae bacterium]